MVLGKWGRAFMNILSQNNVGFFLDFETFTRPLKIRGPAPECNLPSLSVKTALEGSWEFCIKAKVYNNDGERS